MKKLTFITFFILSIIGINSCDIANPGPIDESALHNEGAIPGIVVGMSADFSRAFRYSTLWGAMWSGEVTFSGTWGAPTSFLNGNITSEMINPWWNQAQKARWEAEHGIKIIKEVLDEQEFAHSGYVARAYLWAGYSNRQLGYNACYAVINGGPKQDNIIYFKRAKKYFLKALEIANNINKEKDRYAALGGLASVYIALGNWELAAEYAEKVPVEDIFYAFYSDNSGRENNRWHEATIQNGQFTVYGTKWVAQNNPRLPQKLIVTADGDTVMALNGSDPWIKQMKYPERGSDMPLTKGTTMLLVRAEYQLRVNQNVQAAIKLINKERSYYGMATLDADNIKEAWDILQRERGEVLWLEGRRFWDLRRWYKDKGPAHNDFLKDRDKCVPIGQQEINTNPNF